MDGELSFEQWFDGHGWDEKHRDLLKMTWNAALESAAHHVITCEGTDFSLLASLQA